MQTYKGDFHFSSLLTVLPFDLELWHVHRLHHSFIPFPIPQLLVEPRSAQTHATQYCCDRGIRSNNLSRSLTHFVQDGSVLNVILIVSLEFCCKTVEGAFQRILGGSVDHLGLDSGIIWRPCDECDLAS